MNRFGLLHKLIFVFLALSFVSPAVSDDGLGYMISYGPNKRELVRVHSGSLEKIDTLGGSIVYGVGQDRMATIVGVKNGFQLRVFNYGTFEPILEKHIKDRVKMFISGAEAQVIFSADEERLYFVTLQVRDVVNHFLNEVEIDTGALTQHLIPQEVYPSLLFSLPQGLGLYNKSTGRLVTFSPDTSKFAKLLEKTEESAGSGLLKHYIYLPRVGILRVDSAGKLRVVTDAELKLSQGQLFDLKLPVQMLRAASWDGKSVVMLGTSKSPSASFETLVLVDPVQKKELWRKKLPSNTSSLSLAPDGSYFNFINLAEPSVMRFHRKADKFESLVSLPEKWVARMRVLPIVE